MRQATKKNDDCTGEYVDSLSRPKRSRKKSGLRSDVVYSIPKRLRSQMTVEAMIYMMSEGLRTEKKRQLVQKRPNSADQFWQAYQAEYEARERAKADYGIAHVESHNAAYPKLQVELDEKRSTSKPLAIREPRSNLNEKMYEYDPKCELCVRMRNEAVAASKANKQYTRIHHERFQKSRVTKMKTAGRKVSSIGQTIKKVKPNTSLNENRAQKGQDGNDNIPVDIIDSRTHVVFTGSEDSRSAVGSQKNPESTEPSVSSFNSVLSLDHEPMVTPE